MYTSVLTDANDLLVEEFIQMYSKSDSVEEKERIVMMLSEVQDEDLIEKKIRFVSFSKSYIVDINLWSFNNLISS